MGGHVEEWHIPRKTISTLLIATTDHAVTEWSTSGSLGDVSWVHESRLTAVQEPHSQASAPALNCLLIQEQWYWDEAQTVVKVV